MEDHSGYLHAIVDMGSNGIRFSITDLHPRKARLLPTIYQHRSQISLYDAQWIQGERAPIPDSVIEEVIEHLLHFNSVCKEFRVPPQNKVLIATQATRTAMNGRQVIEEISRVTKFSTKVLTQAEEARYGSLGIASSCHGLASLTMDLGGGSCQLGWVVSDIDSQPDGNGGVSLPYGAAELSRLIKDSPSELDGRSLKSWLADKLREAKSKLEIPNVSQTTIRLTGGGFRGLGYYLMSKLNQPYPIPIINGFVVHKATVTNHLASLSDSAPAQVPNGNKPASSFGVSKRRASQLPAVSLLFQALQLAFPLVTSYEFVQGGLREGYLWPIVQNMEDASSSPTRPIMASSLSSLEVATQHCRPSSFKEILDDFLAGIPAPSDSDESRVDLPSDGFLHKVSFLRQKSISIALVSLIHTFSNHSKESASSAALHCTINGFLAASHGLSHHERALVSLVLSARYGLDLPKEAAALHDRLENFVGLEEAFWASYAALILKALGEAYPRGQISKSKLAFSTHWVGQAKSDKPKWELNVSIKVHEFLLGGMKWYKGLTKLCKLPKCPVKIVINKRNDTRHKLDQKEIENTDEVVDPLPVNAEQKE